MSKIHDLGKKGEQKARYFLQKKGFIIKVCNWRYKRAEVDIIAEYQNLIVFIEVKTRSSELFGYPEDAVNRRKQELFAKAAAAYIEQFKPQKELRFDVVSVIINGNTTKIFHIEDAFFLYD